MLYHIVRCTCTLHCKRIPPAFAAADELIETLPEEALRPFADWFESFIPMKQHVFVRFGLWDAIVAQPLPQDAELYSVTTAMMRYARSVAYANLGDVAAAESERDAFFAARDAVPDSRMLFNNTCVDILKVAEQMLLGELEYRKGNLDTAFDHLRRSVELDDNLPYDEPWGWMQPTRHALGALLLEQNRLDEAESVYRADLGLDTATVGWSGAGQEITTVEDAPAREAGEIIEDEGEGFQNIVAKLEELKVI